MWIVIVLVSKRRLVPYWKKETRQKTITFGILVSFLEWSEMDHHPPCFLSPETVLFLNSYLHRGKTLILLRWFLPASEWSAPGDQLESLKRRENKEEYISLRLCEEKKQTKVRSTIRFFCLHNKGTIFTTQLDCAVKMVRSRTINTDSTCIYMYSYTHPHSDPTVWPPRFSSVFQAAVKITLWKQDRRIVNSFFFPRVSQSLSRHI